MHVLCAHLDVVAVCVCKQGCVETELFGDLGFVVFLCLCVCVCDMLAIARADGPAFVCWTFSFLVFFSFGLISVFWDQVQRGHPI